MEDNMDVEEARTYQWWAEFLEARKKAVQAMLLLDKSEDQIYKKLQLDNVEQVTRIIQANGLKR
jgi:hypothetical protein